MGIAAINAAPAKMIREPRRVRAPGESFQATQMLTISSLRRSEIHRNSVLHDFVLLQDLVENPQRASAINHEILGDDFKPVHDRLLAHNVIVVRSAQSDPYSVVSKIVVCVGRHVRHTLSRAGRPCSAAPEEFGVGRPYLGDESSAGGFEPSVAQPPLPLHEFLPLQPLSLALQPPLPLQEFWPLQACFSFTVLPESCP